MPIEPDEQIGFGWRKRRAGIDEQFEYTVTGIGTKIARRVRYVWLRKGPHVIGRQLGAPGTMGESRQVGSDKTADGLEQNRAWWSGGYFKNEGIAGA
jgi:hypothetical protein